MIFQSPTANLHGGFLLIQNTRGVKMNKNLVLIKMLMIASILICVNKNAYAIDTGFVVCCTDSMGRQCIADTLAKCATACPNNCQGGGSVGGDCDPCPIVGLETWQSDGIMADYEYKLTGYSQNELTCECRKKYLSRCKSGRYKTDNFLDMGIGTPAVPNCAKCPAPLGSMQLWGNSDAGSTSITDCYATSGGDDSGNYTFTENCYYTE